MRILIVVDVYPPEVSSAAALIKELANNLVSKKHEVFVATTFPKNYLAGEISEKYKQEFYEEDGIKIIRAKTPPLKKVNFIIRGLSQIILPFLVYRKIKKYIKGRLDGVIVYSPPLPLAIAGILIKRKYKSKFILMVADIFPQIAIDLGILKNKLAIIFFETMEKIMYKNADFITFHTEKGRQFLIDNKNVDPSKIALVPNWVDVSLYSAPLKIDFRKKFGLQNKFTFLFGGIMGPAQGLDFLIEVAHKVKHLKDVAFLLVGDGMEKNKIIQLVEKYKLNNVIIKNFVSKDEYPDLVKSADVGLVCLSSKNKTSFIPGKFQGYLAAGIPVLSFLNKESGGFKLIEETGCGYAIESGDLDKATVAVEELYANKKKNDQMGKNGKKYAKKNLDVGICADKFIGLIE
jgi:glycosyltransferase involved in cell wall biosynthesis